MTSGMLEAYGLDLFSFAISVLMLLAYQIYLAHKTRQHPEYTVQAVNRIARSAWVETIMREGDKEVLAVQTLRNSTMAATFLASTSVLFIIGVLSFSGQGDKLGNTGHVLNLGSTQSELWMAKLLMLLIDLFVAFFSFSMAVRIFNHVGYMINVPTKLNHAAITPAHVAVHLNRAGKFHSIGMRAYYYTVPLVFWLFGPHFMVLSTLGLIVVLYHMDRAPKIPVDNPANPPQP